LIAYSSPSLTINVTRLSEKGWIKIAPYLIVRLIDKVLLPDSSNFYINTQEGKGGGEAPDYFLAVLSSGQKSVFRVPKISGYLETYLFLHGKQSDHNLNLNEEYILLN
jgi:hypothetical protein